MPEKYCIFCEKMNANEKQFITKNEHFLAWWDENPVTKGHSIVISKKHIESFFELDDEELKSMYSLIKKVKQITDDKHKPDAYNIGINDGEAAGRTIDHLHIHIIPRYQDDVANPRGGVRNIIPEKGDYKS
jgi:diadenosine tetraphosphate (Ap4A) HIT family hydrolase